MTVFVAGLASKGTLSMSDAIINLHPQERLRRSECSLIEHRFYDAWCKFGSQQNL
jgi:hypothetical protein